MNLLLCQDSKRDYRIPHLMDCTDPGIVHPSETEARRGPGPAKRDYHTPPTPRKNGSAKRVPHLPPAGGKDDTEVKQSATEHGKDGSGEIYIVHHAPVIRNYTPPPARDFFTPPPNIGAQEAQQKGVPLEADRAEVAERERSEVTKDDEPTEKREYGKDPKMDKLVTKCRVKHKHKCSDETRTFHTGFGQYLDERRR